MENFPYSNFHDMNLDWIISEHKKLSTQQTNLANRVETLIHNIAELAEQVNNIESPTYKKFSGTLQEALDAGIITFANNRLSANSRIVASKYGRVVFLYCMLSSVSSTIPVGTHLLTIGDEWIPIASYASVPSVTGTSATISPWLSINGRITGTGSGYVLLRGSTINTTSRMYYATYINYEEEE